MDDGANEMKREREKEERNEQDWIKKRLLGRAGMSGSSVDRERERESR